MITVGVVGAGAMGSGIAHVALVNGHNVVLADLDDDATSRACATIDAALRRDVEKGRLSLENAKSAGERLKTVRLPKGLTAFSECGLVIEAIVEELKAKQSMFQFLESVVTTECILATNTSSLSVTSIAAACESPHRVVGMHFSIPRP